MTRYWDGESDNPLAWGRYAAALKSAICGRRGQKLLRDLIAGLDALPKPELSAGALGDKRTGCVCALGAVALYRGEPFEELAKDNGDWSPEDMAPEFDIAPTLANEIVCANDGWRYGNKLEDRQSRWRHIRAWAVRNLAVPPHKPSTP